MSRPADQPIRILFVCLGNICRSPTAEGVMRELVREAGLEDSVDVESAGTGAWHVGSAPDRRATEAARSHGVTLEGAARQVGSDDFERFDLLIAMDRANARDLRALADGERQRAKVRLLRAFDPASSDEDPAHPARPAHPLDVPDPYYGAGDGFAEVFELVHAACAGLLDQIQSEQAP